MAAAKRFGSFRTTKGTAYSLKGGSSASKKIRCVVYLLEEITREWNLDVSDNGVVAGSRWCSVCVRAWCVRVCACVCGVCVRACMRARMCTNQITY